jgi:hypothetical protein
LHLHIQAINCRQLRGVGKYAALIGRCGAVKNNQQARTNTQSGLRANLFHFPLERNGWYNLH